MVTSKVLDDKYEIIREIKQGGFGIVYYGIDHKLNKRVAIKEITPGLVEDPKYLDMFQEEALNIAKLSHNNIVHIYELTKSSDGRLYIIMEYIDGIDLEKIIRVARRQEVQIPTSLAVFIISEICMALDYAYYRRDAFTNKSLKLIHQDISPSNIMISRAGEVKLIDFGIASVKRHRSSGKKDKKLRGKIPYMSPEQIMRGNHPDHRSDLFSLGLVLYETLSGERLFDSQDAVVEASRNPKWLKRALRGKQFPLAVEKIISNVLEIDLSKRYQDANHMYIDLLQYLISCNQAGELTDNLARFVKGLFRNADRPGLSASLGVANRPNSTAGHSQNGAYGSSPNRSAGDGWSRNSEYPLLDSMATMNGPRTFSTSAAALSHGTQTANRNNHTSEFEVDEPDDLKTVIDVLRTSARRHRNRIFQAAAMLLVTITVVGALDTMKGWTRMGIWMNDWLFPPAVEIATVPPNAIIYLDDERIDQRSPARISEVSPGVHKLQLILEGYKPIVKSLFVPRDGAIRVQDGSDRKSHRDYTFHFSTEIALASNPPGAEIFINGVRYTQQTPCAVSWEVGQPLSIELQHPGFHSLSGFSLNTLHGSEIIEDRRSWQMQVIREEFIKYAVNGTLKKDILLESVPSSVEVYDYETRTLMGVTGKMRKLTLPAGRQELELRKRGFIPQRLTVNVDHNASDRVQVVLQRELNIKAVNKQDNSQVDIGANLISLKRAGQNMLKAERTTPFGVKLPAYAYTAVFQKPGYQKKEIRIAPGAQYIKVEMEPAISVVSLKVIDAYSDQPISDAEIYYGEANGSQLPEIFLDLSDLDGTGDGKLAMGDYTFKVKKPGYHTLTKTVSARSGKNPIVLFRLQHAAN